MEETRFDRLAKGLTANSSRRRVLAGLGTVTTGALVGRSVAAAPSERALCMRECNRLAKESRGTCAGLKGRDKRDCLKESVKEPRAACHEGCRA